MLLPSNVNLKTDSDHWTAYPLVYLKETPTFLGSQKDLLIIYILKTRYDGLLSLPTFLPLATSFILFVSNS